MAQEKIVLYGMVWYGVVLHSGDAILCIDRTGLRRDIDDEVRWILEDSRLRHPTCCCPTTVLLTYDGTLGNPAFWIAYGAEYSRGKPPECNPGTHMVD
jgi:hypothetical protein